MSGESEALILSEAKNLGTSSWVRPFTSFRVTHKGGFSGLEGGRA